MASALTRVKDKLTTATASASISPARRSPSKRKQPLSSRKESPPSRVIPPEPVQQQPEGELTSAEAGPALQIHNLGRANKNVPKLEWDDRLARDAQEYASTLAATGKLEHSIIETQGENLFVTDAPDVKYEDAVTAWMKEEKQYHDEAIGEGAFGDYGQFTQCLWHSTTHIGMGKATSEDRKTYIVARYSPRGNVQGEKPFLS